MRKSILLTSLILSIVFLTSMSAFAKDLVKTLPEDITLAQSQKILNAALKKAVEIKVPMNIAIVSDC